jgi:hypothetical protein
MAFCPHCGKQITDDVIACPVCGKDLKPAQKAGSGKFKGTILMPSADALKPKPPVQPAPSQPKAQPPQPREASEGLGREPNRQDGEGTEKPKRAFQGTIMGTGPVIAKALDEIKAQAFAAPIPQAASPSAENGIGQGSPTSPRPIAPKGRTIIAAMAPPVAAQKGQTPPISPTTNSQTNMSSEDVSVTGETELSMPALSMPIQQTEEPFSVPDDIPVIRQPEDFKPTPRKIRKSGLGMWLNIGLIIIVFAAIGAIMTARRAKNNSEQVNIEMAEAAKTIPIIAVLTFLQQSCVAGDCSAAAYGLFPQVKDQLLPLAKTITISSLKALANPDKTKVESLKGTDDESKATTLGLKPEECTRLTNGSAKAIGCKIPNANVQLIHFEKLDTL